MHAISAVNIVKRVRTFFLAHHSPPLSDLCRETSLDCLYGSPGSAAVTSDEVETVLALGQIGIRGSACFAGNVFYNVPPQNVLNLLLLETTLDDQTS